MKAQDKPRFDIGTLCDLAGDYEASARVGASSLS